MDGLTSREQERLTQLLEWDWHKKGIEFTVTLSELLAMMQMYVPYAYNTHTHTYTHTHRVRKREETKRSTVIPRRPMSPSFFHNGWGRERKERTNWRQRDKNLNEWFVLIMIWPVGIHSFDPLHQRWGQSQPSQNLPQLTVVPFVDQWDQTCPHDQQRLRTSAGCFSHQ